MNTSLWQLDLLRAQRPEDVLCAVRDYLVLWRPDELAALPLRCQPRDFVEPRQVRDCAAALLGHEEGTRGRTQAREALTAFFLVAARRLDELEEEQAQPA